MKKVKQMQTQHKSAAWNLLVKGVKNATKKPRTPPTTKTGNGNLITQQHTKLRGLKPTQYPQPYNHKITHGNKVAENQPNLKRHK